MYDTPAHFFRGWLYEDFELRAPGPEQAEALFVVDDHGEQLERFVLDVEHLYSSGLTNDEVKSVVYGLEANYDLDLLEVPVSEWLITLKDAALEQSRLLTPP